MFIWLLFFVEKIKIFKFTELERNCRDFKVDAHLIQKKNNGTVSVGITTDYKPLLVN